tara:strand:- start:2328 stop:3578 length:1251 start_codon:yes stop_codon:yes gene_type:complete
MPYGYGASKRYARSMKLKHFVKSAVRGVKSFIVNKAVGNINPSSLVSSFVQGKTINVGNTSGINKMLKKSPFEINSDRRTVKDDPLKFQHLQYPPELTGNELGNWILFFTISSNVGDNPAENPDLKLARSVGLNPGGKKIWANDGGNPNERKAVGFEDDIRQSYKDRGITIPRINKTNTVLRDMPSKDIISGAIALYMPPDIKVSYGAGWGTEDMGISGDIAEAYKNIKDKDLGFMDAVKEARQHGSGIVMQKGKEFVSAITSGAGMGDWVKLMGKGMGLAINNHAEMLYEGPHFREFTYSFRFWPRNPDETEKVKDIIKMFKYHMHPGKNKNAWHKGRMFDYPSEFEIHYLHNTGINDSLNKISRCALKKCDVSYVPSESPNFKTFEDHNPVTYSLDLTFGELEYMTKDKIMEGF